MCPHTTTYVSSSSVAALLQLCCSSVAALLQLCCSSVAALLTSPLSSETVYFYMCPHTTTYVSSYYLLHICPHTTTHIYRPMSSHYCACPHSLHIRPAKNKEGEEQRSERSSERCNRAATELQQSFPHSFCICGRLKTRRRRSSALSVAQKLSQ
jgi:hypothetical protein